jgi:hypothetical protein
MATVTFLKNNQPLKLENIEAATKAIVAWAEDKELEQVRLHLESENKLLVQIGDETPLTNWLSLKVLQDNDQEALTDILDAFWVEYRRRVSGYGKFDR